MSLFFPALEASGAASTGDEDGAAADSRGSLALPATVAGVAAQFGDAGAGPGALTIGTSGREALAGAESGAEVKLTDVSTGVAAGRIAAGDDDGAAA
ncbi:MAG TPA: hypothetical protein VLW75_09080, partial [Rhizomicrobium sp.]|nr:hypothetical protein [Rhizomicrobium sp.]